MSFFPVVLDRCSPFPNMEVIRLNLGEMFDSHFLVEHFWDTKEGAIT